MRRSRIHLDDDVRELDHRIGDVVYLRCRDEPVRGIVIAYVVEPGQVLYRVAWGDDGVWVQHHAVELSAAFVPRYGPPPAGEGE